MSSDIYGHLIKGAKMKNEKKNLTGRSQLVGNSAIVEKRVWVASDGTEFADKESAEKYEEIMQNPHYKTLKEKVEQLERTVNHLQHDLLMERSKNPFKDVTINRPPYLQPSYMAYNPTTGANNG